MRLELIPIYVLNNGRQASDRGRRPKNTGRPHRNNQNSGNRYPEATKGSFAGLPIYTPVSFEIFTSVVREELVKMMEKANKWLWRK